MGTMIDIPELSDSDLMLGTTKGLPAYDEIPKEFRPAVKINYPGKKRAKRGAEFWIDFFNDLFFHGIDNLELVPQENVDPEKAFQHIGALMRSWRPSHGHKEAGCAYLMSQYFKTAKWDRREDTSKK